MSHIGKKIINIPSGATITLSPNEIVAKGPKGELRQQIPTGVIIEQQEQNLVIKVTNEQDKKLRALWGLMRSLAANIIEGVTKGFTKQLEVNGVGFRVALKGNNLEFALGFSHPVVFNIPEGVKVAVEKNVITISGIDKQLVGQVAANIREIKKPEPYKGKGIKYVDEVIRRKAGKLAKAAAK